jgi:hypothetical protein
MRGWERVTLADLARLQSTPAPPDAPPKKPPKYRAEPCIVTADGTLFTAADVYLVEIARNVPVNGTLQARAARCGIVGEWFASTKEGKRYLELRMLERSGVVTELRWQVTFDLTVVSKVDGLEHAVGTWTADFVYRRQGERIIEDTKSKATRTQTYRLRKKIFETQYGLRILET